MTVRATLRKCLWSKGMAAAPEVLGNSCDPVVVVGGGSAGCVVAARLAEDPSVSVLLLEAGTVHWCAGAEVRQWMRMPGGYGKLQKSDLDWQLQAEPHPATHSHRSNWPRGKVLGGCSAINAMFYVRGHKENYNEWAERFGCRGWSFDECLPYFKRSENCRLKNGDEGYHGREGPLTVSHAGRGDVHPVSKMFVESADAANVGMPAINDYNGEKQEGAALIQSTVERGERCSTVCFLKRAAHRSNLTVDGRQRTVKDNIVQATLALVTRVLTQGSRAIGVSYKRAPSQTADLSDAVECVVTARKEVIVCAGAVHTPALLMRSGIGPRRHLQEHGIPVVADLPVGDNLQDHLLLLLSFKCSVPTYNGSLASILKTLGNGSHTAQYVLFRRGVATGQGCEAMSFARTKLQPESEKATDLQIHFLAAHILGSEETREGANLSEERGSQYSDKTCAALSTQYGISIVPVLLQPRSVGTIRLRSADPLEDPIINANYLEDQRDVDLLVHSMEHMKESAPFIRFSFTCVALYVWRRDSPLRKMQISRQIARSGPFAKVIGEEIIDKRCKHSPGSREYDEEYVRNGALTIYHPVGTARMGARNDGVSVVDPELKVFGVTGLRVADASVMPRIVSGNTNAPVIMIGERCADFVRKDHGLRADTDASRARL